MTVTVWPSIGDYSTAVQVPDRVFSVPEIAAASFATRAPLHLPVAASGANAVVFRADVSGTSTAVRCFTSEPGEERTRYLAFADHVAESNLQALTPPRWHDHAIFVAEAWRPVVTMPWVMGQPLHRYVEDHLDEPAALVALAERWVGLLGDLSRAEVAHGDLQHGNVLVTASGSLRLIDFDGVWIPSIANVLPTEWGHPNYQHPERGEQGTWGRSIDWFAGLVIDVSLRATAADPTLWELHNEENLIFTEDDFRGSTPLWDRLAQSRNKLVRERSKLLAEGCAQPAALAIDLPTLLEQGFAGGTRVAAPSATTDASAAKSGLADAGEGWWQDNGTSSGIDDHATNDHATDRDGGDLADAALHGGDQNDPWSTQWSAADTATSRMTFDWSVDTTGQVVVPWGGGGDDSTSPPTGATSTPPERQRTIRQPVNAAWDGEDTVILDDGKSRPTASASSQATATPPPPGATRTGHFAGSSPPLAATIGPSQGSWGFLVTMIVALAVIVAASEYIVEPQVRNVVLAITVGFVLIDLVRVTRR